MALTSYFSTECGGRPTTPFLPIPIHFQAFVPNAPEPHLSAILVVFLRCDRQIYRTILREIIAEVWPSPSTSMMTMETHDVPFAELLTTPSSLSRFDLVNVLSNTSIPPTKCWKVLQRKQLSKCGSSDDLLERTTSDATKEPTEEKTKDSLEFFVGNNFPWVCSGSFNFFLWDI